MDKAALQRVVWNESRGNPFVGMDKSNYSAGIAQISRAVWRTYSSLPYADAANARYYKQNIEVAAKYLKALYNQFGSWKLAMAAYNEGPNNLNKILRGQRGLSPITVKYIAGVNN